MNNDNQIRSEKIPSAWLVTGGRMFKDRAYISEAGAVKSAQERGDGASVEPLYLDDQLPPAPVAEEMACPESGPAAGIEAAARWVEGRRDAYIAEHGSYDPDTGATEFPGDGEEYVEELDDIAEGVRSLIPAQPAAQPESEPSYFIVCGNIPGAMPALFADQQSATHYAARCDHPQSAYIMPLYAHPQSSNQQPEKEPVAWMHDKDGRVDVIHKDVKKVLADWDASKQGTGDGFHRPLATVEHYTIPLYTHPQPAVDVDALAEFIKNKYPISWEYGSRELAKQICNWIEEQQSE